MARVRWHATGICADRSLVNRHQGRWAGRKTRLSLWNTWREAHAWSGETNLELQRTQSITDAGYQHGRKRGMWRDDSMFCNELINCAVRLVHFLNKTENHPMVIIDYCYFPFLTFLASLFILTAFAIWRYLLIVSKMFPVKIKERIWNVLSVYHYLELEGQTCISNSFQHLILEK